MIKKILFHSSFFLPSLVTCASNAMLVELPMRPRTEIERISPEFYSIKVYDLRYLQKGHSLTALLYNAQTNHPFLFLPPKNYNRKVNYLPYILNAIPTVQIEATKGHFAYNVTHLAVHKANKKAVSTVVGIAPKSEERIDSFVCFTIPKKSFPFSSLPAPQTER